jgi:transposase
MWACVTILFGYLVQTNHKIEALDSRIMEVRTAQEREWAQASNQRIVLRDEITAMSAKLTISPAQVMTEVQEIKKMMKAEQSATKVRK